MAKYCYNSAKQFETCCFATWTFSLSIVEEIPSGLTLRTNYSSSSESLSRTTESIIISVPHSPKRNSHPWPRPFRVWSLVTENSVSRKPQYFHWSKFRCGAHFLVYINIQIYMMLQWYATHPKYISRSLIHLKNMGIHDEWYIWRGIRQCAIEFN